MDEALEQSWANVSAAACLSLPTPDEQVACSAQQLNITDPPRQAMHDTPSKLLPLLPACTVLVAVAAAGCPRSRCSTRVSLPRSVNGPPLPCSIYDWASYSFLWTPVTCLLSNVTYSHRVDQASAFNYCTVPVEGSDAFLFASLALLAGACSRGKLAVVWVLLAGKRGGGGASGAPGRAAALLASLVRVSRAAAGTGSASARPTEPCCCPWHMPCTLSLRAWILAS